MREIKRIPTNALDVAMGRKDRGPWHGYREVVLVEKRSRFYWIGVRLDGTQDAWGETKLTHLQAKRLGLVEHYQDSDCDVDLDTRLCRACGVYHDEEPCAECGSRAFHRDGCSATEVQ